LGADREHAAVARPEPGRRRAAHEADRGLRADATTGRLTARAGEEVVGAGEVGDESPGRPLVELLRSRDLEGRALAHHSGRGRGWRRRGARARALAPGRASRTPS